jgi:hypothetical protein
MAFCGKGMMEKIRSLYPDGNLVYAATIQLYNPIDIRQFYQEYAETLRKSGNPAWMANPEFHAKEQIYNTVENCEYEIEARWKGAIEGMPKAIDAAETASKSILAPLLAEFLRRK